MESRHVSAYYTRRCQRHKGHVKHRYPKLSATCDTATHLFLSAVVTRGPKPDHCEFRQTLAQAVSRQRISTLVGDAGYDSEAAHQWCRDDLNIQSIFPTTSRGRPRLDGRPNTLTGRYRCELDKDFPQEDYNQRWQIETDFSMLKRLLGSAVRSRRRYAIDREIILRVLTINLMIVLCLPLSFQQSRTVSYFSR
ncbi:MAG: transposase [Phycisphaerae bacterium]|nr:transposase [Phycisphaerae bacterium]